MRRNQYQEYCYISKDSIICRLGTTGAIAMKQIEKVVEPQPLDVALRSLFGSRIRNFGFFGFWTGLTGILDLARRSLFHINPRLDILDLFQENFRACADISIAGLPAKTAPFHFNPSK